MLVILLDKIVNLGNLNEQVNVKPGYARNFLIPQGKAILATKKNLELFKIKHIELLQKLKQERVIAKDRAAKLNELNNISIISNVGSTGKLFGSIGARDIALAITAAGVMVDKNEVRLPNGSLRTIGNHHINIQLHNKVIVDFNVIVLAKNKDK